MAIGKEKRTFCFSAARVKEENGDNLKFSARGGPAFSLTALRSVSLLPGKLVWDLCFDKFPKKDE